MSHTFRWIRIGSVFASVLTILLTAGCGGDPSGTDDGTTGGSAAGEQEQETREPEHISIVSELEGGGLRDEGYRATADALQSHPGITGIFAINDPSALGAWTALQQVDRQDDVVIVGFDGQLEGKEAIRDGMIYADPIQFPRQMGQVTVQNIVKYLDGEDYEEVQLIPTELYRQADAAQDPELSGESSASAPAIAESDGERGTIGFSALTLQNPFFKTIADSMTAEAARHDFQVTVIDADRDVNEQTKHIDNFIAQQMSAIVINPADRDSIGPAIRKANEAGIPVFTCDLQCVAEGVEIAGHIGTDNYQGGRLAGIAMIEALGEEGGEVLVLHFKQANSCVLRVQGFQDELAEHNARMRETTE